MIKYNKLFATLARKGMKKTDLVNNKIISSPTLAKLSKNEPVNLDVIDRLCQYLEVPVNEVMEVFKILEYKGQDGKIYTKEVPTDYKTLETIKELITSDMMKDVMEMFKTRTGNEKLVNEADELIKKTLNLNE